MEIIKDSQGKECKLYEGTSYHISTPKKLVYVLDHCIRSGDTFRIYLGDRNTGEVWNEEYDVRGRIGRSTGDIKIPLIVHPLSHGGPGLLDHCILKVVHIKTKLTYYQHPKFQQPEVIIEIGDYVSIDGTDRPFKISINGEEYARCKTERQAKLLKTKMS